MRCGASFFRAPLEHHLPGELAANSGAGIAGGKSRRRHLVKEEIMDLAMQGWLDRLPKMLWSRRQCPLCSSVHFAEAEAGPLDGLLGMFMLRPVRCVNCWRRYYWFAMTSRVAG